MTELDNKETLAFDEIRLLVPDLYRDAADRLSRDLASDSQITIDTQDSKTLIVYRHKMLSVSVSKENVAVYLLPAVERNRLSVSEFPSRLRMLVERAADGAAIVDAAPITRAELGALVLSTLNDLLRKAAFSENIRLTTEQTSLTTALRDLLSEKQRLVATMFHQQEQLYKQVSMELHDTAIGDLVLLQRQLKGPSKVELEVVADSLEQTIQKLRDICADLSSREIRDWGLVHSLEELCQRHSERSEIEISFSASKDVPQFPFEVSVQLYRIAQEALTNAIKYSGGTQVKVSLLLQGKQLTLAIADNGTGFSAKPPAKKASSGQLGLKVLKERAELISFSFFDAQLAINTSPTGSTVTLTMDLSGLS